MDVFKDAFSVAIVFAIGGSLLGSLIATDVKRYGRILSGLMVLAGIILSVSVADYFFFAIASLALWWCWCFLWHCFPSFIRCIERYGTQSNTTLD